MRRVSGIALVGVLVGCGASPATGETAPAEPVVEVPQPGADGAAPGGPPAGDLGTLWVRTQDEPVQDAVDAGAGGVITLNGTSTLSRRDAGGREEWRHGSISPTDYLMPTLSRLAHSGRIFVNAMPNYDGGPFPALAVIAFDPDGRNPRIWETGNQGGWGEFVEGANGAFMWSYWHDRGMRLLVKNPDGKQFGFCSSENCETADVRYVPVSFSDYEFDPSGNIVVFGTALERFTLEGQTFGGQGPAHPTYGQRSLLVLKFSPEGKLVWGTEIPGIWGYGHIALSAKGTVVAAGSFFEGTGTWAGTTLSASKGQEGAFLMVIEADGRPRWMKQLPTLVPTEAAREVRALAGMALDPVGKVTVVENALDEGNDRKRCTRLRVTQFNLAGASLSVRDIAPACKGDIGAGAVVFSPPDVTIGGRFSGTVDFGAGPQSVPGDGSDDGFLLRLRN